MVKKITIFIVVYLLSLTLLIIMNDDVPINEIGDKTLQLQSSINLTDEVVIVSQYNDNHQYHMTDEELSQYAAGKIRVITNDTLVDTIEVYTIDVHSDITTKAIIESDGNVIKITSDLGPLTIYKSSTFITFGQFDANYFNRVPTRIYEVHIPKDMQYEVN